MLGNRRVLECSQDKGRQGQKPSGSTALAHRREFRHAFPPKLCKDGGICKKNPLQSLCNEFFIFFAKYITFKSRNA